jgi:hypothetical protein
MAELSAIIKRFILTRKENHEHSVVYLDRFGSWRTSQANTARKAKLGLHHDHPARCSWCFSGRADRGMGRLVDVPFMGWHTCSCYLGNDPDRDLCRTQGQEVDS